VPVVVDLVRELLDIGGDLGLQRGRQHLPRASRMTSSISDRVAASPHPGRYSLPAHPQV
jgi:hypothetical protein